MSLFSIFITLFFIKETYIPRTSSMTINEKQNFSLKEMLKSYTNVFKDKLFMFYIAGAILVYSLEQSLSNYIGIRLEKEMTNQSASFLE